MHPFDSHCHIQDKAFDDDRDAVLARALDALDGLVVVGDDLESSRAAVALVREGVFAAVGVHPYHAGTVNADALGTLRELAQSPGVAAIGEIGLDYFKYNETPRPVQQEGFRLQLELAAELGLPVVIHSRESSDDVAALLDGHHQALRGGVMHCFAGDRAFVERCLGWGFHISFAGNVTFPKAGALRNAAEAVPLDRLLVETDSPYLAPQAVRGKRCEPAFVQHTCAVLAGLKGVSPEALAEATTRNARALFGIGCVRKSG